MRGGTQLFDRKASRFGSTKNLEMRPWLLEITGPLGLLHWINSEVFQACAICGLMETVNKHEANSLKALFMTNGQYQLRFTYQEYLTGLLNESSGTEVDECGMGRSSSRRGRNAYKIGLEKSRHRWEDNFNPLNAELNPICHLLALVGARHIVYVSRIRVKRQIGCYGVD